MPSTQIKMIDIQCEDLRHYKVNNEKIRQTGWTAHHTIEDEIKDMLTVFKEHRLIFLEDNIYSNTAYINA